MVNGEFNRGRSSLQDEFLKGRAKSVNVPETIDADQYCKIDMWPLVRLRQH